MRQRLADMSGSKGFHFTNVPFEGRRVRGVIVNCGHCARQTTMPVNTFAGGKDADAREQAFVMKKLEAVGWKPGKSPEQVRCPSCFAAIKNSAIRKSEAKKVEEHKDSNVISLQPVSTPREMSREDRRIIFEKLNEAYVSEKVGYSDGWTDARIATDLGTPREWVRNIREEMFGPEGSNSEIREAVSEAKSLLGEIKSIQIEMKNVEALLKNTLNKADKIEKTVISVEQSLR